jgi:hypothetical protein
MAAGSMPDGPSEGVPFRHTCRESSAISALHIFFTKVKVHCCKCLIEHPKLYLFFTKICFLTGKVPDGRRFAPYCPDNPTSLHDFKERVLTNFGGAAKMDSNRTPAVFTGQSRFIRGSSPPEMTKDDRNLNFHRFLTQILYQN